MENSVILSFFIRMFHSFMTVFEKSSFRSFQKKISGIWFKYSANSCIVNYFKTYPVLTYQNSLVYRIFCKVFLLFSSIAKAVYKPLSQTAVFGSIAGWYKDFFNVSIRGYGLAVFCTSVSYMAGAAAKGILGRLDMVVATALSVISVVAIFADKSLASLISNSFTARFFGCLFDIKVNPVENTKKCSMPYLLTHSIVGIVIGAFSGISGNLYLPLIAAAFLALGAFAADYRISIFAALILMPFLPTMAVVGMVLVSFVFFALRLMIDNNYRFVHTPLDAVLAVFAVVMGISAVTSFARGNSINIFLVYFAFILSYYLTVNAVRTKKQLYTLILSMLFAGGAVAIYGIFQHIFGFAEGTTWTDTEMFSDIETRVISTFGNPNVLGEYLLLLIPVAAGYILARPSNFGKLISLIVTALLCLCMVYTYSRGNWIGLMAAILVFFMFYDGRFVWFGMLALLFAPLFLPQTIINRILSVGNTSDTSTSYRVYIWFGTLAMLRDYWFSGIGLGSEAYGIIYPYYSYSGIVAPHSHNLYLQIIVENGFVGLISFAAVVLTYFRMCISSIVRISRDKMLKVTILGLCTGMFGYLIQGMFDNVWYNYRIVFMFFIILALTSCAVLLSRGEASDD